VLLNILLGHTPFARPLYSVYAWTIELTVPASSMTGSLGHSEISILIFKT
jgi:hypothetical protein